ncbi:MFS transporter [Mycobacterium montefiorense]|uniref:MFS transporter n=1 Tax=Mycobacterium montefiorense TaxID=154654 RepID=A0AA37UX76_9MYCO|nr:MFS transporter [Mycobacterium montefiorense]GBG35996.1 MFS transporter [Mycobacterium montefiorense]GKU33996.1 MFS transporter [Mycobacterium montefiorense]GKU41394.1 MFS transporter [Mycobacterium montefiorense]GKU47492.1 MFS transporter [Mycobacterium montefiorense]GKU52290.1 MFS transporter [Mycobacterium montefiorense]
MRKYNPWPSLGALVVGFFMIILDMTIVAVANPAIMKHFNADVSQVIWVTSAYLLTFAIPLLVAGRIGDHFGPKNLYIIGLAMFSGASLACGLSTSIEMLIAARAVQGVGAALVTPQTMAVITRTFPTEQRGAAMSLWGATAGLANLLGPLIGGVLVGGPGWQWIFFVNVPVGVVGLVLAIRFIPTLPTHKHRFDTTGVVLSGLGMFGLVFGVQEGPQHDWPNWILGMIAAGIALLALFVRQQRTHPGEPLMPVELFRNRNFSLATLATASISASVAALMVPTYFYLEVARDMVPTRAVLVFVPMAISSLLFTPIVSKLNDRIRLGVIPTFGFALFALSICGFAILMTFTPPIQVFVLISAIFGIANACIWAPLATTATVNLPEYQAGAGAGVYNAIRQVGAVIGSSAIAVILSSQMLSHGLGPSSTMTNVVQGHGVPIEAKQSFSAALAGSMYLPFGLLTVGLVSTIFIARGGSPRLPNLNSYKKATYHSIFRMRPKSAIDDSERDSSSHKPVAQVTAIAPGGTSARNGRHLRRN